MLRTPEFTIVAKPQRLRIVHSCSWEEEVLSQDLFTKDVGRALVFGASHGITTLVETLSRIADQLPKRAVARHAALALAHPWMRDHRILRTGEEECAFNVVGANTGEVRRLYEWALLDNQEGAVQCFGTTRYEDLSQGYAVWLEENGVTSEKERNV